MIGCPVFTPYNTDNTVNYNLIKYQCDILVRKQFDAVLIGGTTGEWIHLSINERIKLIEEWSKCVKDTNIKLIVHVSDLCIHNINELINVCKINNVYSSLIIPQQLNKAENLVKYLTDATDNFPFIYYHYPELYGYNDVNIDKLLETIPNMIGAKIVDTNYNLDFKSPECIFVSAEKILSDTKWNCTFIEEFLIDFIGTDKLKEIYDIYLSTNKKEKCRYLISKLYNIDLGSSRTSLYSNLIDINEKQLELIPF